MKKSNRVILIELPYNHQLEVSPELWLQLQECPVYSHEGWGSDKTYKEVEDKSIETDIVPRSKLELPSPQEIDINTIMAENNRLTRLVDKLEAEIKSKLTKEETLDTFLEVI